MNIIEFKSSSPSIGLITRNGARGPEADLIESFISFIPDLFRWKNGAMAIFQEPCMETGFPDLVAIQYIPESFTLWPKSRSYLQTIDLKVMHHLLQVRGAESAMLFTSLGISSRTLLASLERLLDANMITRSHRKWIPKPLKNVFGIRAIIAVEAKIKNWPDAFHQGQLNQWFASQTYVLSPVEKPKGAVMERANQTGVGILLLNGKRVRHLGRATRGKIPCSYGSWMFNEWIGRRLQRD